MLVYWQGCGWCTECFAIFWEAVPLVFWFVESGGLPDRCEPQCQPEGGVSP